MNDWKIEEVETLNEEEQNEYIEKLQEKFAKQKANRKKVWEVLFAAGALGILTGATLIGVGGEALNTPGAITIIASTLAEFGITFGALSNISDIENEAKRQIAEVKNKISKTR